MSERAASVTMEIIRARIKALKPVAHLMVACFLFYTSILMTVPFLVDILLNALCKDHTECSEVIVLMGAQQLITGFGAVVLAPILGSISDDYGRKPVFKIILYTAILPSVILAYKRTQVLVCVWFLLGLVLAILRDGGLIPAALAYVADVVDERHRASAVGFTIAAITSGTLVGTVLAFFIKVNYQDFWTAAALQVAAAIYLQLFVVESNPRIVLLPAELSGSDLTTKLISKPAWTRQSSNIMETAKTIGKSARLRTIALVDFMNSFAMTGMTSFLLYYLKAAFGFGKEEYSVIVIIGAVSSVFGQMFIYPAMANIFGERGVVWIALVGSAGQYFLYSFAWASWVPYAAATAGIFPSFFQPAVGTMVSRGLHHDQQGKIQGFMGGVRSIAVIISPLVLTPLAAISLVDNPTIEMPGLAFVVCGAALVGAWLISLGVPSWSLKETEHLHGPFLPNYDIDVQAAPQDALQDPLNPETVEVISAIFNKDTKFEVES